MVLYAGAFMSCITMVLYAGSFMLHNHVTMSFYEPLSNSCDYTGYDETYVRQ